MKRLLLILLLVGAGCAYRAPWVQVEKVYSKGKSNFSVELPEGWMRLNNKEYLLVTRDGMLLQNIFIGRLNINKELKHTKKKFAKGMLPHEVAEVILDNISSDPAVLNFVVMENVPATISGFSGFRVVFTYKTEDGLRLKSVYYGFITDEWFYVIRYTAAQRYYFDKDIKTFEKVLESFKLIKTTYADHEKSESSYTLTNASPLLLFFFRISSMSGMRLGNDGLHEVSRDDIVM